MGKKIYEPLTLDEHKDVEFFMNILIEEGELICDLFSKKYNKSTDQFKYIARALTSLKCTKRVLKEQCQLDKVMLKDKSQEWDMLYGN